MAGKTVTDVVHVDLSKAGKDAWVRKAEVTLADGRTGTGSDNVWFGEGQPDSELVSRAIQDAHSKPVPKK